MDENREFVAALRDELGDDLRAVDVYCEEGYRTLYIRDDVDARSDDEDFERIHREQLFQGIGRDYAEDLYEAGSLNAVVLAFEEALAVNVPSERSGVFVSMEADADPGPRRVIELCASIRGRTG